MVLLRYYYYYYYYYCGQSLKRSQLYELVTHEEGPNGWLGGEHQALWSYGPSWEAMQVARTWTGRITCSLYECAP